MWREKKYYFFKTVENVNCYRNIFNKNVEVYSIRNLFHNRVQRKIKQIFHFVITYELINISSCRAFNVFFLINGCFARNLS